MLKLVVLDLAEADISRFEEYEKQVIPRLAIYGARMEMGIRSIDGLTETHILYFPDTSSYDRFISDPVRAALKDDWQKIGAVTSVTDVNKISY